MEYDIGEAVLGEFEVDALWTELFELGGDKDDVFSTRDMVVLNRQGVNSR